MTVTATRPVAEVQHLPIAELVPGLDFRLDDNTDDLTDLAVSICEHGVLQPLVVREIAGEWEVVAGRRRLAASRIAGLDTVPCLVRSLTDDEAADIALTENIHRRDLSAVEEALAFARLRDKGLTQTQIAKRVGRSQNHVSMLLRVLELPAEIRDKIHQRKMSYATAIGLWGRKRFRESGEGKGGGKGTHGALTGSESELVSYWRRRHDRVVGGLYAIQKARPVDADECLRLVDKVLKLDTQPFAEGNGDGQSAWEVFMGKGARR